MVLVGNCKLLFYDWLRGECGLAGRGGVSRARPGRILGDKLKSFTFYYLNGGNHGKPRLELVVEGDGEVTNLHCSGILRSVILEVGGRE